MKGEDQETENVWIVYFYEFDILTKILEFNFQNLYKYLKMYSHLLLLLLYQLFDLRFDLLKWVLKCFVILLGYELECKKNARQIF